MARVEPSKIMSTEKHATTAAIVPSQEARGRGEDGKSASPPPAGLRLWSWSTNGQRSVLRDSVSSKVAPAAKGEVELQDVESGTAPPSPPVSKPESLQSVEGITTKPQDKVPLAAEGRASCLGRALLMYSDSLDKHPVVTKSISSGLIGLLGDVLAQSVECVVGGAPAPWNTSAATWRSCAVMIDGFFINGPLLHYAYEALEDYMPAGASILSAVMQVGVDVFVIDPVFAFIFVWSTGVIEGRSIRDEILHTIQYDYPTMVLWLIVIGLCWAPLQIYLFNRYPVQYRVLTADLIDLVWTCVSSFFCHV